jgi:hypothetical protein
LDGDEDEDEGKTDTVDWHRLTDRSMHMLQGLLTLLDNKKRPNLSISNRAFFVMICCTNTNANISMNMTNDTAGTWTPSSIIE